MTVRALCNHNVATIDRNAGVVDAAARMREEHVGDLSSSRSVGGAASPSASLPTATRGRRRREGRRRRRDYRGRRDDLVLLTVAKTTASSTLYGKCAAAASPGAGGRRAGSLIGVLTIDDVIDHFAVQLKHIADIIRVGQRAETDHRR